jgi:hypothetical protein
VSLLHVHLFHIPVELPRGSATMAISAPNHTPLNLALKAYEAETLADHVRHI